MPPQNVLFTALLAGVNSRFTVTVQFAQAFVKSRFAPKMGSAGSVQIKKKGEFLQIKDDEGSGTVKRIIRLEDGKAKISVKKVFLKISDITTVSQKLEENDVVLTLKNEAEYCLDGLEEPDEVRKAIQKKMIQDEDDEDD